MVYNCMRGYANDHKLRDAPRAIGSFSKPRRQRQRERGKTKYLMSRTMALHVHNKIWYIS